MHLIGASSYVFSNEDAFQDLENLYFILTFMSGGACNLDHNRANANCMPQHLLRIYIYPDPDPNQPGDLQYHLSNKERCVTKRVIDRGRVDDSKGSVGWRWCIWDELCMRTYGCRAKFRANFRFLNSVCNLFLYPLWTPSSFLYQLLIVGGSFKAFIFSASHVMS